MSRNPPELFGDDGGVRQPAAGAVAPVHLLKLRRRHRLGRVRRGRVSIARSRDAGIPREERAIAAGLQPDTLARSGERRSGLTRGGRRLGCERECGRRRVVQAAADQRNCLHLHRSIDRYSERINATQGRRRRR